MKRVALFLLTNLGVMLVLGLAVNCPVDKVVLRNQNEGPGMGYYPTTIVMDLLLGVVAALIVSWFSRQREFRVDAGAARLRGRKQPISMRWPAWAGWTRARCPSPCNPWASMPAPAG